MSCAAQHNFTLDDADGDVGGPRGYITAMAGKLILTIWLTVFTVVAQGEVTVVRVIPVNDPRLPALSTEETTKLLDVAATMIRRSYDREVKFELQPAEALPKWFDDRWAKISPYEIPREYRADLFDEDLSRFEQAAVNACKLYGTVEQLKLLLDEDRRGGVTNIPSAAKALLEQYKANRSKVREMTLGDGTKLVGKDNWRIFSHGHWGTILAAGEDIETIEVYLTNVLLVDDYLSDPAPHALASSLAYAFLFPTTNRVIVTTYPMLEPQGAMLPPAVRTLSRDERKLLIPYAMAHEVGTHLLLQIHDSYAPDSGLARPMRAIADPSNIAKYDQWPAARLDLRKIDQGEMRVGVLSIRLDVAIARKDRKAAARSIFDVSKVPGVQRDVIKEFSARFMEATWD